MSGLWDGWAHQNGWISLFFLLLRVLWLYPTFKMYLSKLQMYLSKLQMYLSKMLNVFVQIAKCICLNCKCICLNCSMYLSKLQKMYLSNLRSIATFLASQSELRLYPNVQHVTWIFSTHNHPQNVNQALQRSRRLIKWGFYQDR